MYGDEEDALDTEMLYIFKNWEMFLQLLDPEKSDDVVSNYRGSEICIFARRWRPSTLTLEPFVDVPLAALSRIELGKKLSEMNAISIERIEITKAPGSFPCEGSVLTIHEDTTWCPLTCEDGSTVFKWPCSVQNDGDVVYWRDKDEEVKKLSEQERKEILRKENGDAPVDRTYATSSSSRKERPLKIFVDTTCPAAAVHKDDIELD